MKNIKRLLTALLIAYALYAVGTKAYHVDYTPLPAGGADVAP